MAKIVVEIEVPGDAESIRNEPDWFDSKGSILIDEAFLLRSDEDNSFFEFSKFEIKDH